MTSVEIQKIQDLQNQGKGYRVIAKELSLPVNTVKSWCSRHKIEAVAYKSGCLQCGMKLSQTPHRKKKKFCSNECRMAWWNSHPDKVNRTVEQKLCANCGQSFASFRKSAKFCGRACYAKYRSKVYEK